MFSPLGLMSVIAWLCCAAAHADDWPQFRGPNGSGVSQARGLPVEFGPGRNLLWKVVVPPGKSSPILTERFVLLTAYRGKQRIVLCLERATGKLLWQRSQEAIGTVRTHPLNDPASPTPVTDGRNIYAFFPDFGLVSYQLVDGKERWKIPLGPFLTMHGVSASPVTADGKVVLLIDQTKGSYLAAFDSESGKRVWKTERPDVVGGYSSPVVYRTDTGAEQILVFSGRELAAYSAGSGQKLWGMGGLGYQPHTLPVIGNGLIYVNAFGSGEVFSGQQAFQSLDKNGDGRITPEEWTEDWKVAALAWDQNRDGAMDKAEWQQFAQRTQGSESSLTAVRIGASDDHYQIGEAWRYTKSLPLIASPLFYDGVVYLVKDGGVLTALESMTGRVLKQGRLTGAMDRYFASPVAGDGKVFVVSEGCKVSVLAAAAGSWEILAVNDLGESCYSTPALGQGRVFVRTLGHLYAFGK